MVLSNSFPESMIAFITFECLLFSSINELFPKYAEPRPYSFIWRSVRVWASGPPRKMPHSASQGG